jgi:hypothetical protein
MNDFRSIGIFLVTAGVLVAAIGALFMLSGKVPWLGHLPGDIGIERKNFRVYFPLGTCLLLSIALTILLWLFRRR